MPPNKSAHGGTSGNYGPVNWQEPREVLARAFQRLPVGSSAPPSQRYYAQCETCSSKQSAAMRTGKRVLVTHFAGWDVSMLAAIPSSMRHVGDTKGGAWGRPKSWRWKNVSRHFEEGWKEVVRSVGPLKQLLSSG